MLRSRIHQILDGDPYVAPPYAKIINAVIVGMIVFSIAIIIAESHKETFERNQQKENEQKKISAMQSENS